MGSTLKTDAERLAEALAALRARDNEISAQRRQIRDLQKENDSAADVREMLFEIARRDRSPPKWLLRSGVTGNRGTPITIWSDWHYGEVVKPKQVGGKNEFNAEVAAHRAKKLTETTIDLAFHHMGRANTNYPGIVICLGGDMVGGTIHDELTVTNDRTLPEQIDEMTNLLCASIDNMAVKFGNVFLPCVVGNHGRSTRKPPAKDRVKTNWDWNVYCNVARYFRNTEHVQFMITEDADAHFKVYNHRYLLTHGDALGVKGGDGIIGAIGPIMRGTLKVHRSEAQIGRDFDTLLIGHWHQHLTLPGLVCNNAFKGYDEFARLFLRAPFSRASQALWFTHPEHGVTAHWQVYLQGQQAAAKSSDWVSWNKTAC